MKLLKKLGLAVIMGVSSLSFADQHKSDVHSEVHYISLPKEIDSLSLQIKNDPHNASLYDRRGTYRAQLGIETRQQKPLEEAIGDFLNQVKFAKNKEDTKIGYWHAAESYLSLGNYQEAIRLMSITVDCYPEDPQTYWHRLLINEEAGMCHELDADYDALIKLQPESIIERAVAMDSCGRYEQAIHDYTVVIDGDKSNSGAYFLRGRSYEKAGNYERAITDISRAIALDKDKTTVKSYLDVLNDLKKLAAKQK